MIFHIVLCNSAEVKPISKSIQNPNSMSNATHYDYDFNQNFIEDKFKRLKIL